jgi:hypothetical protein
MQALAVLLLMANAVQAMASLALARRTTGYVAQAPATVVTRSVTVGRDGQFTGASLRAFMANEFTAFQVTRRTV